MEKEQRQRKAGKEGEGSDEACAAMGSNICSRNTRTREHALLVLDPLTYRDSQSVDMQLPGNFCSLTGVEFALVAGSNAIEMPLQRAVAHAKG